MVDIADQPFAPASTRRAAAFRLLSSVLGARYGLALAGVTFLTLCLNLWSNSWGLPDKWHPDEIVARTTKMVLRHSIDPEHYAYGGLHYYIVAAGAVIPAGIYAWLFDPRPDEMTQAEAYAEWRDTRITHVYLLSRSISAVLASSQVLIVYGIGLLLFGRLVAISAALFLAVAPYFVVIAHFATVDTAANFWYWLSILFLSLSWKQGNHHWHLLGALVAGFAIGTKLDRAVILFPLLLLPWLSEEDFVIRRSVWSILLVLLAYVASNPMLILSPFEFLDGTLRWLFLNMVRTDETSYIAVIVDTMQGLGLPLFIAAFAGLVHRRNHKSPI
jgi:Dolichyl-phosphate-mannose-protein mannosyltransferase